jgi:hypothetical protein
MFLFLLAKNINKETKFPALIWKLYIYLEITFNDAINIRLMPIIVI